MTAYSIGQLAREFDVSTRTLRFYEGLGLLTPKRIGTDNQTRIYDDTQRTNLMTIIEAKALGYRVDRMKQDLMQPDGRIVIPLDVLRARANWINEQLGTLGSALTRLYAIEREQLDAVAA